MKHSIRTQLIISFAGLIAVMLALYLLINNLFLENFYISQKETDLIEIYNAINSVEDYADYQGDAFDTDFRRISGTNNVSLVILYVDTNGSAWAVYQSKEDKVMFARIQGYLYGFNLQDDERDVLLQTDSYRIQKFKDSADSTEYLEAWGRLDNGCYLLMRIPLQSIVENVKISNQFTLYIILAATLLSIFFVWWISKRISEPIRELTILSRRMANLEFDAKYTSGGKDEIGELGANFNRMSEKLESTISELKKANNSLKQDIEQKEKLEQMRTEFLGNVSHELKTPIALIQGYAEGLKEGVSDDPESRQFYCDVIMDEAAKMNQMVKNLLTLNQLEFGDEDIVFERFDIAELIRGVLQSMEILAQQAGADVHFDCEGPVCVWADEFKIEQVLRNYISNAIHHVGGDKVVEIKVTAGPERARISVFNTGQPIPEEDLGHIWEKFYKVDKAHTREYGGNGIGLSIVRAIMESLHQEYGVKNYENGVEFWFELDMK